MKKKDKVEEWIKSRKGKWYLANLENNTYDPTPFKDFESATKVNLSLQLGGYGDMIIPTQMEVIKRDKMKKARIIPR